MNHQIIVKYIAFQSSVQRNVSGVQLSAVSYWSMLACKHKVEENTPIKTAFMSSDALHKCQILMLFTIFWICHSSFKYFSILKALWDVAYFCEFIAASNPDMFLYSLEETDWLHIFRHILKAYINVVTYLEVISWTKMKWNNGEDVVLVLCLMLTHLAFQVWGMTYSPA